MNGHPLVPVRLVQLPPAPRQVSHESGRYTKADWRTTPPDSPPNSVAPSSSNGSRNPTPDARAGTAPPNARLILRARCAVRAGSRRATAADPAAMTCRCAQEELGKALWIYDVDLRRLPGGPSRGDDQRRTVNTLAQHGKSHIKKHLEAVVFGDELAQFWGHYSAVPATGPSYEEREKAHKARQEETEAAARKANPAKQRGFHVDQDEDGTILSPTAISAGTTEHDLQTAARVIEMLLINDHVRMKSAAAPYDSTHGQQNRLLPIAHPEEWASATGSPGPDSEKDGERARPALRPAHRTQPPSGRRQLRSPALMTV
ncbi:AbiV family abortive infection protein [Streptomyces sp. NPDC055092]